MSQRRTMTLWERRQRRRQRQHSRFLAERQSCLGGSDMPHLVSLAPYGCVRRLWYDKKGVPADYPFLGNRDTQRGTAQEPVAVELYQEVTRRRCFKIPFLRHPLHAWMGVHPDRLMSGDDGRQGILEVKVPGRFNFGMLRSQKDMPGHYALQIQWALAVTGLSWGGLCAFTPETHELLDPNEYPWLDIGRNEQHIESLTNIGSHFWGQLALEENPFPFLERSDPRCAQCPWRRTCQGLGEHTQPSDLERLGPAEVDETLGDVIERYLAAKLVTKQALAYQEGLEAELKARLGERSDVECAVGRAYWYEYPRHEKAREERTIKIRSLRVIPYRPQES